MRRELPAFRVAVPPACPCPDPGWRDDDASRAAPAEIGRKPFGNNGFCAAINTKGRQF